MKISFDTGISMPFRHLINAFFLQQTFVFQKLFPEIENYISRMRKKKKPRIQRSFHKKIN
jgi:hypothetical protein